MIEVTFLAAFGAGLVSFLAPCTFAALPLFINYLINQATGILPDQMDRYKTKVFWGAFLYVISFLFVFTLMGVGASSIGRLFNSNRGLLLNITSILIIIFGIFMLFGEKIKPLRFLFAEKKIEIHTSKVSHSYLFPITLGITSAFAWTPCIGPILGSILGLASTFENIFEGALLLFIYGLGIQLPFMLVALTLSRSQNLIKRINKYTPIIHKISAILMVVIGIFLLTGIWAKFYSFIFDIFMILGYSPA